MCSKSVGESNSGYSGLEFMRKAEEEILRRAADRRKVQNSNSVTASCSKATEQLSPPLPLLSFTSLNGKQEAAAPQTITGNLILQSQIFLLLLKQSTSLPGEKIRSFPNAYNLSSSSAIKFDSLSDPITAKKLAKWFTARSFKETNLRQVDSFGGSSWGGKSTDGKALPSVALNSENSNDSSFLSSNSDSAHPTSERTEIYSCIVYDSLFHIESDGERNHRNIQAANDEREFFGSLFQSDNGNTVQLSYPPSTSSTLPNGVNNWGNTNKPKVFPTTSKAPTKPVGVSNHKAASLIFDGEFESGNLEKAIRVIGRESIMTPKSVEVLHDYIKPDDVHQEYDLVLRNDLYTEGNIQWYYFSVKIPTAESIAEKGIPFSALNFPLKVRFNIVNMQKKDSLYNYGMKPATYSVNQIQKEDWKHRGEDICYYRNGTTTVQGFNNKSKKAGFRYYYTLTFTYTFERPDTVFFAHSYPYTYSDLQRYMKAIEANTAYSSFFHRGVLCETLAGNRCDILTITEKSDKVVERQNKPSIIITARIHPGESNSSYMVHGLIEFLVSDCVEAFKLRKSFIFTIIPMLNPDGVIHGNYRCSLAGTDLNRRFADDNPALYPTISALKDRVKAIQKNRVVLLYLDLHGHSKLKNSFLYGCDITLQPSKAFKAATSNMREDEIVLQRIHSRIYPHILCSLSSSSRNGYFSYSDCSFKLHQSKMGTGRAILWKELGVEGSYTIESSFCGNGNNKESKLFKKYLSHNTNIGIAFTAASGCGNDGMGVTSNGTANAGGRLARRSITNAEANDNGGIKSDVRHDITTAAPLTGTALLSEILKQYKNAFHYRKVDLLNMGKDICLAVFHFSNLSHSDLDRELQLAVQADALKKVIKSANECDKAEPSEELSRKQPSQLLSNISAHKQLTQKGITAGSGKHYLTAQTFSSDSKRRPTSMAGASQQIQSPRGDTANSRKANTSVFNIDESSESVDVDDEESECERESFAYESEGDDAATERNNSNHLSSSSSLLSARPHAPNSSGWKGNGKIMLIDQSMKNRSILTHSVFASQHLHQMLMAYPLEAIETKPTENLGLRLKSELCVRRMLKCDATAPIFDSLPLLPLQDDVDVSEDDKSANGSESDPSVDNNLAPKLLKKINSKSKDSKFLINAIRVALKKKHKKINDKSVKAGGSKRDEQMLTSSKSADDIGHGSTNVPSLYSTSVAQSSQFGVTVDRSSSSNNKADSTTNKRCDFRRKTPTATKYAPTYRLEEKPYQVPPFKLINFGEYDNLKGTDPSAVVNNEQDDNNNGFFDEVAKVIRNSKLNPNSRLSNLLFDDYELKFGGGQLQDSTGRGGAATCIPQGRALSSLYVGNTRVSLPSAVDGGGAYDNGSADSNNNYAEGGENKLSHNKLSLLDMQRRQDKSGRTSETGTQLGKSYFLSARIGGLNSSSSHVNFNNVNAT